MKNSLLASLLALAAAALSVNTAEAQFPAPYGFLPWGFYQPFGAHYSNSIRTPPYFATNPPVYYGARHARPYGLSPFASPPLLVPGDDYKSRMRPEFLQPRVPTPQPLCNPCVSHSKAVKPSSELAVAAVSFEIGPVRHNPFVESDDRIAQK
jgi:hypothetical protein